MALDFKQKLLGAYFLVEEQYYNFVDWLEDQGRYEFTDYFVTPIEEKGIPSFVVVLLAFLLLFTGAFLLFFQPAPGSASFEVRLYNAVTNEKIDGFVTIARGGQTIAATKTSGARVYYDSIPRTQVDVRVESEGFEDYEKSVDAGKTRFFTARLKPLGGTNSNAFMFQQITEPPANAELPPLPTFEPLPWQQGETGGQGEASVSPTPEGNETNETTSPTPSPSASPSASPTATPLPIREEYVLVALGNESVFEGLKLKLKNLNAAGDRAWVDLLNATTNQTIYADKQLAVNESMEYANVEIIFDGIVKDAGTTKAKFTIRVYAPLPSPSPSAPPAFFANITAPKENDVVYDAFFRITGFARSDEEIVEAEVSTDDGAHWSKAQGKNDFYYDWATPTGGTGAVKIKARARTTGGKTVETNAVSVFVSPCKKLVYNAGAKINVVFAPSQYEGAGASKFVNDIDSALAQLFSRKPFSRDAAKINKINAWYYAYGFTCRHNANVWECDVPANYVAACSGIEPKVTAVIVNSNVYGGGANVGARLLAFDSGDANLFPHEAGHAVFGLADRYCCSGGYWQAQPKPNLWSQQPPCTDYVSALLGSDQVQCRLIRDYTQIIPTPTPTITPTATPSPSPSPSPSPTPRPSPSPTVRPTSDVEGLRENWFATSNWFEQPANSHMQKPEFDFDESDAARINYILENGLQTIGGNT